VIHQEITLSTHVLDTTLGAPASGITIELYDSDHRLLSTSETNQDGRVQNWPGLTQLAPGAYRLRFDVQRYEPSSGFYPLIDINFQIGETPRHYHVPLLLSQYGYSTYLGS